MKTIIELLLPQSSQIMNFSFWLQVFSAIFLPIIVLVIEYLGKTMAFSINKKNDVNFYVDDKIISGEEVIVKTIREYEEFSFLNSVPAVFFSNIVWGLTYIPTNLPNTTVKIIMIITEIIILVFDSILYGYSYLGIPKDSKGIKIIERFIFVILLICSYFMLITGPKIN
ncbi:hypothetical protein SAMN04487977_101603 [Treponema bryantii]|uniref:Uncharacterized protein n=1 Tax=Treponema bryantii TaxID=163 RepID=A0A1H9B784_9SPIR|nr:hypothetical protein [Treponema bryantii]SEP84872.1 hypothetical protein SAMN04487977_101603 [Treponema bryantii]